MIENEIKVAVDWWKSVLAEQPHRDAGSGGDFSMAFAKTLADGLGRESKPTPDQIETFGRELTTRLLAQSDSFLTIGCDYHPDPDLAAAAEFAGINELAFPWKTNMWIQKGSVRVRHGYHADMETLYP